MAIWVIEESPFKLTHVKIYESFNTYSNGHVQLSEKLDVSVTFKIFNEPITVNLHVDANNVEDIIAQLGKWALDEIKSVFT